MRVGYVVLYVDDAEVCRRFWLEKLNMVEKDRKVVDGFTVVQVGFSDQPFAIELVPIAMMADNPFGVDMATPSLALHVADIEGAHQQLTAREVPTTAVGEHGGVRSFGFSDPEGRWFAVTGSPAG